MSEAAYTWRSCITDDSQRPRTDCVEHGQQPAYVYRRQCVSRRTGKPYVYTALNCVICVRLDGRRYSETTRGIAIRKAWVAANRERLAAYQRERYRPLRKDAK